jgi:hypothetical protein
MVKTRGNTGRSGQNRWGDPWPPMGRISGRQWGFPVAAYGENLMATHTRAGGTELATACRSEKREAQAAHEQIMQ